MTNDEDRGLHSAPAALAGSHERRAVQYSRMTQSRVFYLHSAGKTTLRPTRRPTSNRGNDAQAFVKILST